MEGVPSRSKGGIRTMIYDFGMALWIISGEL